MAEELLAKDWGDAWEGLPLAPPLFREDAMGYAQHGDPDYNSKTARGCEDAGEPVFCLRAQDPYAAATVRWWAIHLPPGSPLYVEALRIAAAMDAWPAHKDPD